tara:strand:- start:19 stop:447 length:429 start_codon:yes stop_codon:yes gene_type:complete
MSRGKKGFDISPEMSGEHRTMEGQVPGTVKTAGQFQVWVSLQVETLQKEQRKVLKYLEKLDSAVSDNEKTLLATKNKDDNQETALKEVKADIKKMKGSVDEQGEFIKKMKESHATSIKILTMVGGSLLSVLGSLLIWMLTKR